MGRWARDDKRRGCGCGCGCLPRLLLLVLFVALAIYVGQHFYHGGTVEELREDVANRARDAVPYVQKAPEHLTRLAKEGADLFGALLRRFTGEAPPEAATAEGLAEGKLQVFFGPADPADPEGMDDHFLALVRRAESTVDAAFYELELPAAVEALLDRHYEGVQVRLVTDSRYANREAVKQCIDHGIPVTFDRREPYMHNKFCVVDGRWVWTGSANITENGMYRNDNNALLFDSPALAENYAAEFQEMCDGLFGARSPRATPHPTLTIGGMPVRCYFAPEDGVRAVIISEIEAAGERIDFMAFSFTSAEIAEAMARRMEAGVQVRGLFETRNAGSQYSRDDYLAGEGAAIYLDTNPQSMHNKVIIIDDDTVITGSYNFSESAEKRNDENVLILEDATVTRQYREAFEALLPE